MLSLEFLEASQKAQPPIQRSQYPEHGLMLWGIFYLAIKFLQTIVMITKVEKVKRRYKEDEQL